MADGFGATLVSKDENQNAVANPLWSELTDGTAALHKVRDVAAGAADSGLQVLAVRSDAGGTLVGADGDYTPLSVNASGELRVAAAFTANAEKAEDAAHVSGDTGNFVLAVRQDTLASSTSADGDYASFKVNAAGALYTNFTNTTIAVTNAGTFAVQESGGALTALQLIDDIVFAEDSAHTSTDKGAFVLGVRNTALADLTGTDGDYSPIATTSKGAVLTTLLQGGAALSETNALPVYLTTPIVTGEVHNYDTQASLSAGGTDNHDYTVVNTMKLTRVEFASSSRMKVEIQTGPVASLVTVAVGFIPAEGGVQSITFNPPREVPNTSTGTVRVIRTNRHVLAVDVYSTIMGIDS